MGNISNQESDKISRRYLLLFKLDVKNLYRRLSVRKNEYITIFAIKRSRAHFESIFASKYDQASFFELSHCDEDTLLALSQFYEHVENIRWYLDHTQDMPNTIEDELTRQFHKLDRDYSTVMLYIDAQLGVKSDSEINQNLITSQDNSADVSAEFSGEFGENPWVKDASTDQQDEPSENNI